MHHQRLRVRKFNPLENLSVVRFRKAVSRTPKFNVDGRAEAMSPLARSTSFSMDLCQNCTWELLGQTMSEGTATTWEELYLSFPRRD